MSKKWFAGTAVLSIIGVTSYFTLLDSTSNVSEQPLRQSVNTTHPSPPPNETEQPANRMNNQKAPVATPDSIQSIEDLIAYLHTLDVEHMDVEKILAYMKTDPEAFAGWFDQNLTGANRQKLIQLLGDVKSEVMIEFSKLLTQSKHVANRIQAYKWLGPLGIVDNKARDALLTASYEEPQTDALKELTVSLATSFDNEESAYETREQSFKRIAEFADSSDDPELARVALKEVTTRYQNDNSLSLIRKHLGRESEETKLNALSGLRYFRKADKETRVMLESMLEDPYQSPEVKAKIEKVIWGFDIENQ